MTGGSKKNIHKRIGISLNSESAKLIQKFQAKWRVPKSEVVRRALEYFKKVVNCNCGNISPDTLNSIIKLYSRPDKISIDVSIIEAAADKIGENSEEFTEKMRSIGRELYNEYRGMGFSSPKNCLNMMEKTNLFKIIANSENSFTLVSTIRKGDDFLKTLLEGFLEEAVPEAEIRAEHGKIRISVTKNGN